MMYVVVGDKFIRDNPLFFLSFAGDSDDGG